MKVVARDEGCKNVHDEDDIDDEDDGDDWKGVARTPTSQYLSLFLQFTRTDAPQFVNVRINIKKTILFSLFLQRN